MHDDLARANFKMQEAGRNMNDPLGFHLSRQYVSQFDELRQGQIDEFERIFQNSTYDETQTGLEEYDQKLMDGIRKKLGQ
jgi:hypothetical protein